MEQPTEADRLFQDPGCGMLLDLCTVHTMFERGCAYEEVVEFFRHKERRCVLEELHKQHRKCAQDGEQPAAGENNNGGKNDIQLSDEQTHNIEARIETRLSHYHLFDSTGDGLHIFPQSDEIIPVYALLIANIDHKLCTTQPMCPVCLDMPNRDADDDPDAPEQDEWRTRHGVDTPFIESHGCQVYNEISHQTCLTAGQQEMCKGGLSQAATYHGHPAQTP